MLCLVNQPALAWGAQGHRITGLAAWNLLTPQSRAAVRDLLGSDNLADATTWLDRNRAALALSHPGSAQWHYDDIPLCSTADYSSYCPNGQCATDTLRRESATLSDSAATREAKQLALRIVIHLAADISQPLHAANNADRGGNEEQVIFAGRPTNLHALWDSVMLKRLLRGTSEAAFADQLLSDFAPQLPAWAAGTPQDWADESNALARALAYGELPGGFTCPQRTAGVTIDVPLAYADAMTPVLRHQLAKSAARIASILNQAFAVYRGGDSDNQGNLPASGYR